MPGCRCVRGRARNHNSRTIRRRCASLSTRSPKTTNSTAFITELSINTTALFRVPNGKWGGWVGIGYAVPVQRANYTFRIFLLSLLVVFAFTIGMLNVMLYMFVIRRVKRLSKLADEVSLGNLDAGEFQTRSKDEIGVLTEALGRMKTSMVQAIKMLDAHG